MVIEGINPTRINALLQLSTPFNCNHFVFNLIMEWKYTENKQEKSTRIEYFLLVFI